MADLRNSHGNSGTTASLWTGAYTRALIADFFFFAGAQGLIPIIPLYVYSFGANDLMIGVVAGVFLGVAVILRPFTGWLVDAYGRKFIFAGSAALFAISGLGLPLWSAILPLIVFRLVQGIAWSAAVTATTTLQSDVISAGRRGEGMGYVSSVRNLATALAPAAALLVADRTGVIYALWVVGGLGLVGAGSVFCVRESYSRPESRPLFEWRRLIEFSSLAPSFISAAMMMVYGGLATFIVLDARRRTIGDPAVFFFISSILLIAVRPIAGKWTDAVANRNAILIPGLLLIIGGVWVLAAFESRWTLTIVAALWAFGFGTVQPLIRSLVLERAPAQRWGAANATQLTFYDMGMAVGPPILGYIANTWDYPVMYAISSLPLVACVIGMMVGVFRPCEAFTGKSSAS